MKRIMRRVVGMPLLSLCSTLVWGVSELVALQRARRTARPPR
ncbi:hypothetical protein [Aromatoleum toluvorans]|nr:hypothetical protein [Aromatoleum toluvorans]